MKNCNEKVYLQILRTATVIWISFGKKIRYNLWVLRVRSFLLRVIEIGGSISLPVTKLKGIPKRFALEPSFMQFKALRNFTLYPDNNENIVKLSTIILFSGALK